MKNLTKKEQEKAKITENFKQTVKNTLKSDIKEYELLIFNQKKSIAIHVDCIKMLRHDMKRNRALLDMGLFIMKYENAKKRE